VQGWSLQPIVLASGSASRRMILERAGLAMIVDKPDVDETAIKDRCRRDGLSIDQVALALSREKARVVEARHPGKIVVGCDQMLDCAGDWLDKPPDMDAAARQLARLSGRTHTLLSGLVARRNGSDIFSTLSIAQMEMRPLSPAFIADYLDIVGDRVLTSVGAYQVEGLGIHLFKAITGDHFTIMGLPLLPLLDFLRSEQVIPA
jgi:septum formation protein